MEGVGRPDINILRDAVIDCFKNQVRCKDDISICMENQLNCYKNIKRFSKILSELFNEKISEIDEKLSKFDKKLTEIDSRRLFREALLQYKCKELSKKKDNKVWYLFLYLLLFLCIVYCTIINLL